MPIYTTILILSVSIPLLLSFDKKLGFYKQWKFVFPSIFIIASFHLVFDIYFTSKGVWGFNPKFHSNILLLNLPLEEWFFFIAIPYASLFLHEALILYFPQLQLKEKFTKAISLALLISLIVIVLMNLSKTYTVYIFSLTIIALLISFLDKTLQISRFYVTFMVILFPFILVNAILTGSFLNYEVFWYNRDSILNIRILTIPVEDIAYAFNLILFNLLLISRLKILCGIKMHSYYV